MKTLGAAVASLEYEEPSWLHSVEAMKPAPPEDSAQFLNALEEEDLGLFVLAYGMGMRLGEVSQTLKLDPALVVWRIRRALQRSKASLPPASLELGVTELLRADTLPENVPPPQTGDGTWAVASIVESLDDTVQDRLKAGLSAPAVDSGRSGVGIGLVVLILVGAAGFMVFGAIRDVNPLWRGKDLMRTGRFSAAREAFADYWDPVVAHEQISICYLAVGDFTNALAKMQYPGVLDRFGAFSPVTDDLAPLDFDPGSHALLPRGLVRTSEPPFVYKAGAAGRILISVGWRDEDFVRIADLPDTTSGPPIVRMAYPEAWPTLPPGVVVWGVEDPELSQADFICIDKEERLEIRSDCLRFLTRNIPQNAQLFFRGHYYMRRGLYTEAGQQFAKLARNFPGESYPKEMVATVSGILGVDQQAFLR